VLPIIEGIIARRILVNYRVDPAVAAKLVPKPLEIATHNGLAVVGICLIRLEQLRPRGFPSAVGMSSENMAHRMAIRYPGGNGSTNEMSDGVYVLRRETDQCLVRLLGGRLFPGIHGPASFKVNESSAGIRMDVTSADGKADVNLEVLRHPEWNATKLFQSFDEMSRFFKKGDCGFSCSLHGGKLEGIQLKTLQWTLSPLQTVRVRSAFYDDESICSIGFDCAVMMSGVPHEWHEIADIPEMAAAR